MVDMPRLPYSSNAHLTLEFTDNRLYSVLSSNILQHDVCAQVARAYVDTISFIPDM